MEWLLKLAEQGRAAAGNLNSSSWMSQTGDAGPSASVSRHLLHHLQHFADSNGFAYNKQTVHYSIIYKTCHWEN